MIITSYGVFIRGLTLIICLSSLLWPMFQRTLYCDDNEVLFCYSRYVTDIIYVHPLLRVDSFISVKYNLLPSSLELVLLYRM